MFQGNDDLIKGFLDFIPDEYQYQVAALIQQCQTTPVEAPPPSEPTPSHAQPFLEMDHLDRRRRTRTSNPQRSVSPAFSSPSASRSRRQGDTGEDETPSVPNDVARFFEQVRRDISSEEVYQQFIKLLDAYNRGIFPLSELFSAVTDLLHIRHPVVSHLRNFLAQKGIREDEVGSARRFDL